MNDVSKEEKLDPAKPILWIVIPCYNEKDVLPITAPMFLEQIQTMIDIWNSFPDGDKPEWLTMEQINEFAQKMGVDI